MKTTVAPAVAIGYDLLAPPRRWYERVREPVFGPVAYRRIKRCLDLVVCGVLLPIALLLLAACAVTIKLDSPGPVFFLQRRTGKGGRVFTMYKLRTMVNDAEQLKERYRHLNRLSYPDFKIIDDPRVTPVGQVLRRTSLDEVPQIFNVLRGDMTLVGPRPTSFSASTYQLWHTARLELTPGITGLWQVSGRNELDFDDRLRLDIAYLRNQSVWLDLRILLRTFACVLTGRGAN